MTDWMIRLRPYASRLVALALLLGLARAIGVFLVMPAYLSYEQLGESIRAARLQLGRFDTVLQVQSGSPAAADFSGQSWSGRSRSIIAANLQESVQEWARAHGVSIISISPLQPRPFAEFDTIGLRLECEGEIEAMRDFIAEIESAMPFIFITGTDLRRQQIFGQRQPGQRLPLAARLDLYAPITLEAGQ